MTENIFQEVKGSEITLADGKTYTLAPRNLNTLATIEDIFGCGLDKVKDKFEEKRITAFRLLTFALLKPNYPELTIEDVGRLIDIDKIPEIEKEISFILGR